MNKFILALALVLAPFFSKAFDINIFKNGSVVKEDPAFIQTRLVSGSTHGVVPEGITVPSSYDICRYYYPVAFDSPTQELVSATQIEDTGVSVVVQCDIDLYHPEFNYETGQNDRGEFDKTINETKQVQYVVEGLKSCPPEAPLFNSYTYAVDNDGDGKTDECADPVQIGLVDDCKVSSRDFLSRTKVTAPSVCTTLPDGSICKYDAVDIGGGQQAYDLDLEGDCYSEHKGLPSSDYSNDSKPLPGVGETGYACLKDGGLLTCSEEKEDVTDPNTGEVQEGCGTANIVFICMSGDTDGDGLPDYLDPDIDGDGVPNEDDLDKDGDGKDDPIDNNGSGNNQSGGGGEPTDLSPVVNKLEQIRQQDEDNYKKFHETSVDLIDKPTEEAVSFYESEYEDGLEGIWNDTKTDFENTEMMTFLNTFKDVPSGGTAINGNMCFNLGAMGNFGCGDLAANPIVWGAIRIFILVCAGFLCRALIFGG